MGCRGVLFALTPEQEARLLREAHPKLGLIAKLAGKRFDQREIDRNVLHFLTEEIEERWDEDWLCETDKAWDAIHRCLSNGSLSYEFSSPIQGAILGGAPLYAGGDYVVSYKTAAEVNQVASAIAVISDDDMAARYDALDEEQYGCPKDEGDRQYTVEWFSAVRDFYQKTALAGRPAVFTADQ